ncbi:MAG TPA: TIGR03118 family protein [Pyrinomonadaceae bacterium]|nr:TIGR03118 family protein [Pyrinomonadaceae bacterium]
MQPLFSVLTAALVLLSSTLFVPTRTPPARAFAAAPAVYRQTNLVADLPGVALIQDPLLVDPRGVAMSATSPFWVANNATERATLYRGDVGGGPLVINSELASVFVERGPGSSPPPSTPTGVVANNTDDFVVSGADLTGPARFIFATTGGNLNGWNPAFGSAAFVAKSMPGRVYTGLAIGSNAGGNRLYAADFEGGRIDVFDGGFNLTTVPGGFAADAFVPADFHPFNIQNLGGSLYVTYAQFNKFTPGLPNRGAGFGYVRKFDTNGARDPSFAINDGGALNAPWGLALAPSGFGPFSGDLLVGNYGGPTNLSSSINAFDPATGAFVGMMTDEGGAPLKIKNLWALAFGNGAAAGDPNTLYFTSGFDAGRHGLLGSLKPAQPAPTIQFAIPIPAASGFFVSEGAGHADITVTRTGDASGTATVNYATYDGSATQKSDYEIALGKLTFNPGETQKTFRVLIVNDNAFAGGSSVDLNLVLSNPTGAGLGNPHDALLSISDDEGDTPRQPPNASDDTQFFVRQQYFDFLNREPDASGFNFWVNSIESCGADAQCREVKRTHVSAAFFLSIEFQRTGIIAYLAELAALKRQPPYGQFMRGTQMLQRGLVFGEPGFDAQLEANKQEYFADFVRRPEFVARYPATLTPAEFVNALAGPILTQSEQQAAAAEFGGAPTSADLAARARVLRRVAETPSFARAESNAAFVLMEYFGYLRRNPNAPPDVDFTGYNFWLGKLNQFNGDYIAAEMVKAFISSTEYRRRFGPN